ncbi:uroporphyrinogen-III C-methyltransferase [Pseudidiomarina sp. YC-516-91]|uniref:uroporphyrinogen-III C-methyltransferase n=1 Tax=Pseudidiomarina salilacus TaxID=3384452 RepID=UPI0039852614
MAQDSQLAETTEPTVDATDDTTASAETAPQRRKASLLPWLVIVLLLAVLAVSGWLGYRYVYQDLLATNAQLQTTSEQQQQQLSDLERELANLAQQQKRLPNDVREQLADATRERQRQLAAQAQELADLQRAVQGVQAEFASLDVSQATEWRIIEARHLAERANNKLYIDQQPTAAIQLLELADSHLVALNNPAFQTARQAINDDKVALQGLTTDAHLQVAMQLSSLRQQLQQQDWQLRAPSFSVTSETTPADAPWYTHLQDNAQTLFNQLVRIEHREQPIQPQLSAAFVALAKQRVLLQLQLAQQAALSQSAELYQTSLQEAQDLLAQLASDSELPVQALQSALGELAQQQLVLELPTQLRSPTVLNRMAANLSAGAAQ